MCMTMRGVQKAGASTVTTTMLGNFRENEKIRSEFLSLIKNWNHLIFYIFKQAELEDTKGLLFVISHLPKSDSWYSSSDA